MKQCNLRTKWSVTASIAAVILIAANAMATEPGQQESTDSVATFDFVETPLNDLLKVCANNTGAQLDVSRLPPSVLAEPVSITYRGTTRGFLSQLGNQTKLQMVFVSPGGRTVLFVRQKTPLARVALYGLVGMLAFLLAILIARWAGWRFSLRSLLIATTLAALALGLIVWNRN